LLSHECVKLQLDSVDRLERALSYGRDRHDTLAANIANIDTPGYRPLDLEPASEAEAGGAAALEKTDAAHLQAPETTLAGRRVIDESTPPGPDGNAVSLERELAKIDANRVRYVATAELVSRRLALLRYGASDGAA
jgi:flagellar basal-body rod protein FlgB